MHSVIVSELTGDDGEVEVVERKGRGHPDSICDALAETLSRNLCLAYEGRFGRVLHHNVDKALLCGGGATPAFGGGVVTAPIVIYLAGRAVSQVGTTALPVEEIAIEGTREWLRANLHALDPDRHVQINSLIRPGSQDLQQLFSRRAGVPLANDTSVGVGYAPMRPLEQMVLAIEQRINRSDRVPLHPAWGEDVKVLAARRGDAVDVTVACAMIDRHLHSQDDYLAQTAAVERLVRDVSAEFGFARCAVRVNAADQPAAGDLYLTVTGTSAEAGDDGQVGRGNRVNGLITPYRPMSLEAAAGKNPVSHVGKLYNVLARQVADALVARIAAVREAHCFLLSRIGAPITTPALVHVRLATHDGTPAVLLADAAEEIARAHLDRAPSLMDDVLRGGIDVF